MNGIDMRSLNHFEAVTVLREAADQVTIRVYREPKEVPELQDNYIPVIDGQALSQEGPYGQIKVGFFLCFCVCGLISQSTAMIMSRWSVNLTTLFLGKLD